eukprot:CAMPEP_0194269948 /NCGR_PEP_ID=MMETSP0169-20130528/4033_1 /TAXON_ID=218684 /ORGANISM="Corethron pennatum, Strain L29A3" /LENGTH=240 /DNA_ID=CAMNT_0039011807 /DNA_START=113 /DNA_END=835 /DNA_ORIENTATION=-
MKIPLRIFYFTSFFLKADCLNHGVSGALDKISQAYFSVDKATTAVPRRSRTSTPVPFGIDRRSAALSAISTLLFLGNPLLSAPAYAAADPRVAEDKKKIVDGYLRLTYLLDNWEKETTVCGRTDNPYIGCERTPEKVMEYLGFKSMKDPLYRADKTLIRLGALVPNDSKSQSVYQDALDLFVEKAEEGNGMAFISSWGEANPGGGKDRIELFIERSKKDVIDSRNALSTVARILDLDLKK